ncbi:sialidase family protein [Paenibacillus silvisoli]|uniref:sialidase family protein n=1 Tax=Paenibacillus silvisoli TaxID=3110539 RepID=UPI002805708B|nr:sialidase family protein [Paenibacillus silvisoli]
MGNVYVVRADQFNVASTGNITAFLHRSRDGGLTWDTPVLLSSVSDKVRRPAVTVDLKGNVYAAWITVSENDRYLIRRSLDGGTTFGTPIVVSPVDPVPLVLPVPNYGFRVLTYPSISCDRSVGPNTGAIYAVWQDNREGYADIFMSKSTDEGIVWSNPVSITGAPAGSQNFFPFVDVDPLTGVVNVVYYSNQVDGFDLDVFVTRSINGGQTFTNTRITNVSFNPNAGAGGPDPVPVIGDYITITSVPPGGYIATWMSTSPGSQTIFAGYSDIVIP